LFQTVGTVTRNKRDENAVGLELIAVGSDIVDRLQVSVKFVYAENVNVVRRPFTRGVAENFKIDRDERKGIGSIC